MKVFREIDKPFLFRHAVVTIGTFDGVHKGHQKIISYLNQTAKEIGGESVIITFHPHPRFLINKEDKRLHLLNTIDEKLALLEKYEVDNVVVAPFTQEFSQLSAAQYLEDFLVNKFQPAKIVIGYDHHFGNNRSGNIEMLLANKAKYGYELEEIKKQTVDAIDVSSTKIRMALEAGEIKKANHLLGHAYGIEGMVMKGQQIGRTIGFATANIAVPVAYKLIPATGVYAVTVFVRNKWYQGMLNIGYRPTFEGNDRTIEVHIFDFDQEIYGEQIKIEMVDRIRDEQKFEGIDQLKKQLEKDKVSSKAILNHL
jgi:riboflavin kinase/FMN adenylyltransferase